MGVGWVGWWAEMGGYWGDKVSINFVLGDEWPFSLGGAFPVHGWMGVFVKKL